MYGCEWDDVTEATKAFQQDGYDGEDFLSLDLENMRYIAPVPQALLTKQKYDRNKAMMENDKHYFTQTCVEWLKKYVQYGSSTLGRKVRPEVSLLKKGLCSGVLCYWFLP
ncbi:hypothetical protein AALO_G00259300 [Alosa alosa]|uniref:MHC class I-like antigen recognition-like domain-containing protein n=1 Tax=Alosa alosa TaxID=278164 RepID=A0AAV6FPV1_9TELE|nr:hypothetical protein AALO_G00259300 [Alosa alosa]